MSAAFHRAVNILEGTDCVWSEEHKQYVRMTHAEAVIAAAALAGKGLLLQHIHPDLDLGIRKENGAEPE